MVTQFLIAINTTVECKFYLKTLKKINTQMWSLMAQQYKPYDAALQRSIKNEANKITSYQVINYLISHFSNPRVTLASNKS